MFKAGKTFTAITLIVVFAGILGCGGNNEEQGINDHKKPVFSDRKSPEEILAGKDSDDAVATALTFYVSGLYLFKLHCRTLPTTEQGLNYLVEEPKELEGIWNGPYSKIFNDPWGHPYQYKLEPNDPFPFDLRSLGPDGVESDDDITASQLPSGGIKELAKGFQ